MDTQEWTHNNKDFKSTQILYSYLSPKPLAEPIITGQLLHRGVLQVPYITWSLHKYEYIHKYVQIVCFDNTHLWSQRGSREVLNDLKH